MSTSHTIKAHAKEEINWTKIKSGCQSGRKVVTHNSKSDLPLNISDKFKTVEIRGGPLVGNQEAAWIFIIYIYDIVLEISFLDIND